MVIYLIICGKAILNFLVEIGFDEETKNNTFLRIIIIASISMLIMPFALKRKISGLGKFSLVGIGSVLYILVVVVV